MLSWFARLVLVATSLSPILGAVAVNKIAKGEPALAWVWWAGIALLLVLICWGMLAFPAKSFEKHEALSIEDFESNDKEVLAFLLAYLLPFISTESMNFEQNWLVGVYILLIICLVVTHAGAFHFNPVMGLLGYHFYGVRLSDGTSRTLITRHALRKRGQRIDVVELSNNIYLETGDRNA